MTGWIEVERLGFHWRLNVDTHIGRKIARKGIFEPDTTQLVMDLVKPGMSVLDIGANIGYYTLIMARAVGPTGVVWAFEPVTRFREQLTWHVERNGLSSRVNIAPYGLSDEAKIATIFIDNTSATLHWTRDEPSLLQEQITLHPLDGVIEELDIGSVGLIKLDVDGHEPFFLRGASRFLQQCHPPIALEFAQHCLHVAGSDVREQARLLHELDYVICSERTRQPYASEMRFLMECGNFSHSCNALAVHHSRIGNSFGQTP